MEAPLLRASRATMVALLGYAAFVQLNDPDPLLWFPIYVRVVAAAPVAFMQRVADASCRRHDGVRIARAAVARARARGATTSWPPPQAQPSCLCLYELLRGPRTSTGWAWAVVSCAALAVGASLVPALRAAARAEGSLATTRLFEHEEVREASGLALLLAWAVLAGGGGVGGEDEGKSGASRRTACSAAATLAVPALAAALGSWWSLKADAGLTSCSGSSSNATGEAAQL